MTVIMNSDNDGDDCVEFLQPEETCVWSGETRRGDYILLNRKRNERAPTKRNWMEGVKVGVSRGIKSFKLAC